MSIVFYHLSIIRRQDGRFGVYNHSAEGEKELIGDIFEFLGTAELHLTWLAEGQKMLVERTPAGSLRAYSKEFLAERE